MSHTVKAIPVPVPAPPNAPHKLPLFGSLHAGKRKERKWRHHIV